MTSITDCAASWMSTLDDNLRLTEICMPGAHDAGMYQVKHRLPGPFLTQSISLRDQLLRGVRYFDLRPRWVDNSFRIYHGEKGLSGAKIGNGPQVTEILQDIKNFMETAQSEVVIANFSHFMDIQGTGAIDFINLVDKYLGCYLPDAKKDSNLALSSLRDLRGKVIVIIADHNDYRAGVHRNSGKTGYCALHSNGWFPYLSIEDDYSNRQDYESMLADQSMKFNRFDTPGKLFMLNWTLTAKTISDVVTSTVREFADRVNSKLYTDRQRGSILLPNPMGRIVNIINADYIGGLGLSVLPACEYVMQHRQQATRRLVRVSSVATALELKVDGHSVQPADLAAASHGDGNDKEMAKQARLWIMEAAEGSSFRFTSHLSGLRLDGNNDEIYLHEPNESNHQCWHVLPVPESKAHQITSRATTLALDGNRERIYPHECNDGTHQQWLIKEVIIPFPPGRACLGSGTTLKAGESLVSSSRRYQLKMQDDGNLVLHNDRDPDSVLWASASHDLGAQYAVMESGDLLLHARDGAVVWRLSSHYDRFVPQPGSELVVGDDGTLTVRSASGECFWSRIEPGRRDTLVAGHQLKCNEGLRSPNGRYDLILQEDGNLVVYKGHEAVWSSGTHVHRIEGMYLDFQKDGNLVICRPLSDLESVGEKYGSKFFRELFLRTVLWEMQRHDPTWLIASNAALRILNSGKLALYDRSGHQLWLQQ